MLKLHRSQLWFFQGNEFFVFDFSLLQNFLCELNYFFKMYICTTGFSWEQELETKRGALWGNERNCSKALKIILWNIFGNLFSLFSFMNLWDSDQTVALCIFGILCLFCHVFESDEEGLNCFFMPQFFYELCFINSVSIVLLYRSLWKLLVKWIRSFFINSFMLRHGIGFASF